MTPAPCSTSCCRSTRRPTHLSTRSCCPPARSSASRAPRSTSAPRRRSASTSTPWTTPATTTTGCSTATGMRQVATLTDPASGRRLTLVTDQPGIQVYAGGYLEGASAKGDLETYAAFAGVTAEMQTFPDSINLRTSRSGCCGPARHTSTWCATSSRWSEPRRASPDALRRWMPRRRGCSYVRPSRGGEVDARTISSGSRSVRRGTSSLSSSVSRVATLSVPRA